MRRSSTRTKRGSTGRSRRADIDRKVRAFNPVPGARTTRRDGAAEDLARAIGESVTRRRPGTVCAQRRRRDHRRVRATGRLALLELQRAGGKRLPLRAFARRVQRSRRGRALGA